jgi:hypothetical protein
MDGVSQGYVIAIVQDRRGFMWSATRDGLNRYDGNAFVVYKNKWNDPGSLTSNFLQHLMEASCKPAHSNSHCDDHALLRQGIACVQPLFSIFADRWPGRGLLAKRLALVYCGVTCATANPICAAVVPQRIGALAGVILIASLRPFSRRP